MKHNVAVLSTISCGVLLVFAAALNGAQPNPTSAGSLDTSFFPGTTVAPSWNDSPTLRKILVQPDGRVLIQGGFEQVQHHRRSGLARLNADGSFDRDFAPMVDGIQDVALGPDGSIVVAAKQRGLARLKADGTLDPSFEGQITNGATAVACLPSQEFLAGVRFDEGPGSPRIAYGVALFDSRGNASSRWSSAYRSSTPITQILVAPARDRVIVDGLVEISLAVPRENYRALTNNLPPGFRPVSFAFQPDGKLLVGNHAPEWPSDTNCTLAPALLRLNIDGSKDEAFATNFSIGIGEVDNTKSQVRIGAIALDLEGRILIGGFFTRVNGESRSLVARLLADGQLDSSFLPDIEVCPEWDVDALQNVNALAFSPDGQLLLGGALTRCNGISCRSVARLHTGLNAGGGILAFAESTYDAWETNAACQIEVCRLGSTNGAISVAYEVAGLAAESPTPAPQRGFLVFEPGESRKAIAFTFQDNLIAEGNRCYRLTLSNPTGGAVLTGHPETRVVVLDDESAGRPGSVDLSIPPFKVDGQVYSVDLLAMEPDGSALISVIATTEYFTVSPALLRVRPNGEVDRAFHPVTDQLVSYAWPDPATGRILIFGGFSKVNGIGRCQLARLNHDGSVDPALSITSDRWICGAIVQPDGKILLYGLFNSINSVPRNRFARLTPEGAVDPGFDTSTLTLSGVIGCVGVQADGKVVAGGLFEQVNGVALMNLARLNSDGSPDWSFDPGLAGINASIRAILYQPDGKVLVTGSLQAQDGHWEKVIRLNDDGSLDMLFNADLPSNAQGWPILLEPGGRIYLDGKWRLNPDGSRDSSFLTADDYASVSGASLLPGGDLLVSGSFATFAQLPRPWLARLRGGNAPVFGWFEFADSSTSVNEDNGCAAVRVRRMGPANREEQVEVTTIDGSALGGVDYLPWAETLRFAPGVVEQTLSIPVFYRAGYQRVRSFEVRLRDLETSVRSPLGQPLAVSIFDSNPGVTFKQTNHWIAAEEINTNGEGTLVAYVERHGKVDEPLTVHCELRAETGVEGVDFEAANLTISFEPGQNEAPVMAPLIRNDSATEDRTLLLILNNVDPGWSLATDSTATLSILGRPRPPGLIPGSAVLGGDGGLSVDCNIRPNQWLEVECSVDLRNWAFFDWIYRGPNAPPPRLVDPEAWKHSRRFYRFFDPNY